MRQNDNETDSRQTQSSFLHNSRGKLKKGSAIVVVAVFIVLIGWMHARSLSNAESAKIDFSQFMDAIRLDDEIRWRSYVSDQLARRLLSTTSPHRALLNSAFILRTNYKLDACRFTGQMLSETVTVDMFDGDARYITAMKRGSDGRWQLSSLPIRYRDDNR